MLQFLKLPKFLGPREYRSTLAANKEHLQTVKCWNQQQLLQWSMGGGGQAVLAGAREALPTSWEDFGEDLKEENT